MAGIFHLSEWVSWRKVFCALSPDQFQQICWKSLKWVVRMLARLSSSTKENQIRVISFECHFFDLNLAIECAPHCPGNWCDWRFHFYMQWKFPINHASVCTHVCVCLFSSLHPDVLAYVALTATQPIPPSGEGMPKGSLSAMPADYTWSSMGWGTQLHWEGSFGTGVTAQQVQDIMSGEISLLTWPRRAVTLSYLIEQLRAVC